MRKIIFACGLMSESLQALEVHEWGTFTVLSGSDGNQTSWYSPSNEIARLPTFVHKGTGSGGKGSASFRIRMETPVIYFYPEKPMQVSVEAEFSNGMITETFPYSPLAITTNAPGFSPVIKSAWNGKLLPPTDKDVQARIPAISDFPIK